MRQPDRQYLERPVVLAIAIVLLLGWSAPHARAGESGAPSNDAMDAIRSSYLELRRDTLLASPTPVLPGAGQIAVYVSVDPGSKVTLSAAALTIDDRPVRHEHFEERQLDALKRGAVSRLYVTGIANEAVHLSITLAGTHKNGKPWTQSADIEVPQSPAPRYVEFQLARTSTKGVPDIISRVSS